MSPPLAFLSTAVPGFSFAGKRPGEKKNPLRESNNLGTQRVRASRGGEVGEGKPETLVLRCRGKARGPIPDGLAVTGSIRGNSCQRSAPLNWRRRRLLGSWGGRGEGRQAGDNFSVCAEKLDYLVSLFVSAFPSLPRRSCGR